MHTLNKQCNFVSNVPLKFHKHMHLTTKLHSTSVKGNIQVANMEGDITAMVNIVFIDKISIVEFPGRIALKN